MLIGIRMFDNVVSLYNTIMLLEKVKFNFINDNENISYFYPKTNKSS